MITSNKNALQGRHRQYVDALDEARKVANMLSKYLYSEARSFSELPEIAMDKILDSEILSTGAAHILERYMAELEDCIRRIERFRRDCRQRLQAMKRFEGIESPWSDPYERERFNRIIHGDADDEALLEKMPKFFDKDGNPKDSTQNRIMPYYGEGLTDIAKRHSIPIGGHNHDDSCENQ